MNELEKKLTFLARESFPFSPLSSLFSPSCHRSNRKVVRKKVIRFFNPFTGKLDALFIRPEIFLLDFSWIFKHVRFQTNWLINSIIEYRV